MARAAWLGRPFDSDGWPVFSLLGVLGIAVVLFFVVAITGRLILGR